MSALLITSLTPWSGKTGLSVGIARRLATDGRKVRLLRLRSDSDGGASAEADAELFASMPQHRSAETAVRVDEAEALAGEASRDGATLLIEGAAGHALEETARRLRARVVLAVRGDPVEFIDPLADSARPMGESLVGVVVTAVAAGRREAAARLLIERGVPCLGVLPEDRTLASPRLNEVARALEAEYLVAADDPDQVLSRFMIGSISHDPGEAYFTRYEDKAVITRFDKTDLQLAALNTSLACLILTGGERPSPYLLDRVRTEEAAVLLTAQGTVGAMRRVDELFGETRFGGSSKIERGGLLLEECVELPALLSKLG